MAEEKILYYEVTITQDERTGKKGSNVIISFYPQFPLLSPWERLVFQNEMRWREGGTQSAYLKQNLESTKIIFTGDSINDPRIKTFLWMVEKRLKVKVLPKPPTLKSISPNLARGDISPRACFLELKALPTGDLILTFARTFFEQEVEKL